MCIDCMNHLVMKSDKVRITTCELKICVNSHSASIFSMSFHGTTRQIKMSGKVYLAPSHNRQAREKIGKKT